ncbi:MAG: T9SS type A sorting domain-containing protein [Bacteroidetes bacterium]|nr:T9SS type A sorting domain-containing protein [Bacteroidota bacterium]
MDSNLNVNSVLSDLQLLQMQRMMKQAYMDSITAYENNIKYAKGEDIADMADALNAQNEIETNEKLYTEIYAGTILQGIYEFTQDQINTLIYIANQCPLAGGAVVFRARSLLFMVDETYTYNDREICNAVGITLRQGQQVPVENIDARRFIVFPNPANDAINIVYPYTSDCTMLFVLYDGYGRSITSIKLDNKNGLLTLPTKEINCGVYAYKISCNYIVKTNGKLVIIH